MNKKRREREMERIRAAYYQHHNYTWQYVLQPGEDPSLLSHEVYETICPFQPRNDWTDFIRFKEGPAGKDCDSSVASVLTFVLVYDYLQNGEIVPLSNQLGEYHIDIKESNKVYLGDTLTSALIPFKLYLGFLRQEAKESDELRQWLSCCWTKRSQSYKVCIPKEKDCDRYKRFVDYLTEQIDALAAPIGRVLSENCKLFLENVWNQGNIIPVPEFFNQSRASDQYGDTVDRMLTYLYYFIISDDDKYLNLLFCVEEKKKKAAGGNKKDVTIAENAQKAVKATKDWIRAVCGEKRGAEAWNAFVENHFLQPFCKLDDNGTYIPICMFNGQPLNAYFKKPYDQKQLKFLPDNLRECECFFRTCNTAIMERSRLIQQKINH